MNLQLYAEERTSNEVVDGIVDSIGRNIPQFGDITVERYTLPKGRVFYMRRHDKTNYIDPPVYPLLEGLGPLKSLDNFSPLRIYNPAMDVLEIDYFRPNMPNKPRRVHRYHHMGEFFADPRKDSIRLVTKHGGWFMVIIDPISPSPLSPVIRYFENWYDGWWLCEYNTGIIPIAMKLTYGNRVVSLHEVGHHFNLGHHDDCIMMPGLGHFIGKTPERFCDECEEKIQQYFDGLR